MPVSLYSVRRKYFLAVTKGLTKLYLTLRMRGVANLWDARSPYSKPTCISAAVTFHWICLFTNSAVYMMSAYWYPIAWHGTIWHFTYTVLRAITISCRVINLHYRVLSLRRCMKCSTRYIRAIFNSRREKLENCPFHTEQPSAVSSSSHRDSVHQRLPHGSVLKHSFISNCTRNSLVTVKLCVCRHTKFLSGSPILEETTWEIQSFIGN
jgi:hypothetical protein